MRKISILILSLFFIQVAFSQTLITDQLDSLKRGIYYDFYEFKHNNPSTPFNYNIIEEIKKINIFGGISKVDFYKPGKTVKYYKLKIDKKQSKALGKIYGFCDGKNVYTIGNSQDKQYNHTGNFIKLETIGRYCFFIDIAIKAYPVIAVSTGGISGGVGTSNIITQNVLDIIDGTYIQLSDYRTRKILKSEPRLCKKYMDEPIDEETMKKYIIRYSTEHYSDISELNANEIANIRYKIYKQESDTTYNAYFERVKDYTKDPSIVNIILKKSKRLNRSIKYYGLKAKHKRGPNLDYYYKIGTWEFYYNNGELKEVINYDFLERRHGKHLKYDTNGQIVFEEYYIHGVLQIQ